MKKHLEGLLQHAIVEASKGGALKSNSLPPLIVEVPKDSTFGDLATPVAMGLARAERQAPRAIAETLIAHLRDEEGWVESTDIAGPGYLNFRFSPRFWKRCLADLEAEDCGIPRPGKGEPILVEFVSGNPTGPLHVGHGRGAVTGDVLCRLLENAGYAVSREYYVNDAGSRMSAFYGSVLARYKQAFGLEAEVPSEGYHGRDPITLAEEIKAEHGDRFLKLSPEQAEREIGPLAIEKVVAAAKADLAALGVEYDR